MTAETPARRILVVGGGVAGLRCAQVVSARGHEVVVLEASDRVGGRMVTDVIDGFQIDAGFQLLNPSYPQASRSLDLDGLCLGSFDAGMILADGHQNVILADPLRRPGKALGAVVAPVGSLWGRLRLGALLARARFGSVRSLLSGIDEPAEQWLRRQGISDATIDDVLRPFLAGVLLEDELTSSGHLVALLLRSFGRGLPGLPAEGMGAIPAQMAAGLPADSVRTSSPVAAVTRSSVTLHSGERLEGDAVVVAVAAGAVGAFVSGHEAPRSRSVTTWWFAADEPLASGGTLVVDRTSGPLCNSVEMTAAAPSYAPAGRRLIQASSLGQAPGVDAERAVRRSLVSLHRADVMRWDLVATTVIPDALPACGAPLNLAPPIEVDGVLLAGDHVATPSIQGAMASGERAGLASLTLLDR